MSSRKTKAPTKRGLALQGDDIPPKSRSRKSKQTKQKPIYSVIGGKRMKQPMELFGMKNNNDNDNDNMESSRSDYYFFILIIC